MLISSAAQINLLRHVEDEIRRGRESFPPQSHYESKLAQVWARARQSPAYHRLGEYSSSALHALPPTTKDTLKRRPWDYVVADIDSAAKYYETTGSSGVVTPTPRLAEDIIWNTVSVAEAWRDLFDACDRVAVLLPSDIVPVADLIVSVCEYRAIPHVRAYPFATGITDWDRVIEVFRAFRPTVVFVAPGVAVQFTRLLKQRQLLAEVTGSVRSIMLLGEVSTRAMRARLGAWWGARAYDASYGSTETGTLAASCVHDTQHLLTGTNHFELGTERGVAPLPTHGEARSGTLVVTPLNLHARPLLRLDTEDQVTVDAGCACGSPLPTVTVHGRTSDGLSLRGAELSPRAVEDIVYGVSTATGYLIEIDAAGIVGRLLLERDIDVDRATEDGQVAAVQEATHEGLGVRWDAVVFVNVLAATTKSGGSQKSWKRSNIRVVELVA